MIRIALTLTAGLLLTACSEPAETATADTAPEAAATPEAPAGPPAGLEAFLRGRHADDGDLRYAYGTVDLNGDGSDEVLAWVAGPMVCGSGGCGLYVLTPEGDGWRVVTETSVTQTPIGVLSTSTNGWRDLAVSVGGGGMPAGWMKLAFDGTSYPTNPTVAPAEPLDQPDVETLIASDPEFLTLP